MDLAPRCRMTTHFVYFPLTLEYAYFAEIVYVLLQTFTQYDKNCLLFCTLSVNVQSEIFKTYIHYDVDTKIYVHYYIMNVDTLCARANVYPCILSLNLFLNVFILQ